METTTVQKINWEKNREVFKSLVKAYIKRDGIEDLMKMLDETDFYTAPASTRFHGAEMGGLCAHSITVGKHLMELAERYAPGVYTSESLCIVALFHDLCKIQCYKTDTRNVKNEVTGQWEKKPYYKFEEQYAFGGHGSKSVFLVMEHMKLNRDEGAAINAHMGFGGVQNIGTISDVYDSNLLAWLLHIADEAATYIDKM